MQHVVRESGRRDRADSHVETIEDIAKLYDCHCHMSQEGPIELPKLRISIGVYTYDIDRCL
jgi:hypothetical protein